MADSGGRTRRTAATLAGIVALAGCAPVLPPPPAAPSVVAGTAARPASFRQELASARVRVTVRFRGTPPVQRPIDITPCGTARQGDPEPVFEERIVVGNGLVVNAVVYVSRGQERWTFTPPEAPGTLLARGSRFRPHVLTLGTGQPLELVNEGPCHLHFSMSTDGSSGSRRTSFILDPGKRDGTSIRFDHPETGVRVGDSIHGWMEARIAVFDHHFHGVTGEDGTVELALPPGTFELSLWHEALAAPEPIPVEVQAGTSTDVEFTLEP